MLPTLRKGGPLSCGNLQTSIRAHLRVSAEHVRCSPKATVSHQKCVPSLRAPAPRRAIEVPMLCFEAGLLVADSLLAAFAYFNALSASDPLPSSFFVLNSATCLRNRNMTTEIQP
jgi:hypothetical protein